MDNFIVKQFLENKEAENSINLSIFYNHKEILRIMRNEKLKTIVHYPCFDNSPHKTNYLCEWCVMLGNWSLAEQLETCMVKMRRVQASIQATSSLRSMKYGGVSFLNKKCLDTTQ